jgi:hypothetical protein
VVGEGLAWQLEKALKSELVLTLGRVVEETISSLEPLIDQLHDPGIYHLDQIADRDITTIWGQAWKEAEHIGMGEAFSGIWSDYVRALKLGHIRITVREDELVWKHAPHGVYTPKLGYSQINIDLLQPEPSWWWKGVWKVKFPLKARIFMWCMIKNKIPTWDRMKLINLEGPGWCALCKANEETISHLFFTMSICQANMD